MAGGARFLVLCPECALDEVHRDAAPARRTAERHDHRGATVIRISAIRRRASHTDTSGLLGLILTSADAQLPGKKASPSRGPSQLRHLLERIA